MVDDNDPSHVPKRSHPNNDPHQWLTVRQAAQRMNISMRTVWRLIDEDKIKSRKILGARRIPPESLDDIE